MLVAQLHLKLKIDNKTKVQSRVYVNTEQLDEIIKISLRGKKIFSKWVCLTPEVIGWKGAAVTYIKLMKFK